MAQEIATLREQVKASQESETTEPSNDKVKENIKAAYEVRDAALKEAAELKAKVREAELRALEESGKKEEADKMRIEELQRQLDESQGAITTLTRDNAVRDAVSVLDFKSEKASKIAVDDIVATLIQDANGQWVSPTGQSIRDYVTFYSSQEDNAFLFKPKQSSGSKAMDSQVGQADPVNTDKSLDQMTDAEMLQAAADGKLGNNKQWI